MSWDTSVNWRERGQVVIPASIDADGSSAALRESSFRSIVAPNTSSRLWSNNSRDHTSHLQRNASPLIKLSEMPVHLQHPFRLYDEPIQPRMDILSEQKSPIGTYARPGYFAPFSHQEVKFDANVGPKLLVLGLNGDLARRLNGVVRVRPFIENFMDYILQSVPSDVSSYSAGYEVFFWSTWMPHTAEIMLGKLGRICENWEGKSLGVWTREDCGLNATAYESHSMLCKDLRKLFARTTQPDKPISPGHRSLSDGVSLTTKNTILVDGYWSASRLQPLNHLLVKEFGYVEHPKTRSAIQRFMEENAHSETSPRTLEPSVRGSAQILHLVFGPSSSAFYDRYCRESSNLAPSNDGTRMDAGLIALIGILEELQDVESVPVWLASGGLYPDIRHTFTADMASRGWDYIIGIDNGSKPCSTNTQLDNRDHVFPTVLSSDDGYRKWYDSPIHMLYWVRRGLTAMNKRGIEPCFRQ